MGAIADNKNAAQASECSFEQYTKDAVNCVTKKVRKYRKKLDKIAQTEKLDPEVLNKEQADMIRTKSDTVELFDEFTALEAEIKSLTVPKPVEPKIETKEVVVEKVIEKVIEKAPADLPDTELQTKFNYLHANGILLDADFTDWLKAVVSGEDLEILREWCFSLVCSSEHSSRMSYFANEVFKLGQKSDELPPNCSVSYKTIAGWVEKISEEVDVRERTVASAGGSQRFLEQAKQEEMKASEKQQNSAGTPKPATTTAAAPTPAAGTTTKPAQQSDRQVSSQGKAAPKKAPPASAPAEAAPTKAPEDKPTAAAAVSPPAPAKTEGEPGEKLSFWGTPVVPADPTKKRPIPKKPAATKPETDGQADRKDKGKGKGQNQGDGKGKGKGNKGKGKGGKGKGKNDA